MNDSREPTLVVGVDYSDPGLIALRRAIDLAGTGNLHLVHVIDRSSPAGPMTGVAVAPSMEEELDRLHSYAVEHIEEYARPPQGASHRLVSHVAVGAPAREIAQLASDLEADLIVVGTHGRTGLRRLVLGSVAEGVLRLATCPVLVERPKAHATGGVPEIEPPCPRCVEARAATGDLWCEQHRERHGRRHTYHSDERPGAFPSAHRGLSSIS